MSNPRRKARWHRKQRLARGVAAILLANFSPREIDVLVWYAGQREKLLPLSPKLERMLEDSWQDNKELYLSLKD